MIPVPAIYFLCPKCSNLISSDGIFTGNTSGAIHYSDGKMEAPMMPEVPNLTRCHRCQNILWLSKAKKADYKAWRNDPVNEQSQAEHAEFLDLHEYFEALQKQVYESRNEEIFIRLRILWGFNDRVRKGEPLFAADTDEHLWLDNINQLLALINNGDDGYKALSAELNRYLGRFDLCESILGNLMDPIWDTSKKQILQKCREKNQEVFLLKTY